MRWSDNETKMLLVLREEAFGLEDPNAIEIINHPLSLISTSFQLISADAVNHKLVESAVKIESSYYFCGRAGLIEKFNILTIPTERFRGKQASVVPSNGMSRKTDGSLKQDLSQILYSGIFQPARFFLQLSPPLSHLIHRIRVFDSFPLLIHEESYFCGLTVRDI